MDAHVESATQEKKITDSDKENEILQKPPKQTQTSNHSELPIRIGPNSLPMGRNSSPDFVYVPQPARVTAATCYSGCTENSAEQLLPILPFPKPKNNHLSHMALHVIDGFLGTGGTRTCTAEVVGYLGKFPKYWFFHYSLSPSDKDDDQIVTASTDSSYLLGSVQHLPLNFLGCLCSV